MVCGQSEQQYRAAQAEFASATEALRAVRQSHEQIARTTMQFTQICDAIGRRCDGATPEDIAHVVYGVQRLWDCYRSREWESRAELRRALATQHRTLAQLDAARCRIRGSQ
jgi:hypothetical protein